MVKIRKFIDSDARQIHKIIKACFLNLNLGNYPPEIIKDQIQNNSTKKLIKRSKNVKYFVAKEDGKLIGICGYDKYKVHTLFVDLAHQEHGIGTKLLYKTLDSARNKGIPSLECWSTSFAEKFYSKNGFKKIGIIRLPIKNSTKKIQFVKMRVKL